MTLLELQQLSTELHIPVIGTTTWPLPTIAAEHLATPYPCPFTNGQIEDRLQGGTELSDAKSAIVALFPYYVPYTGPSNLSRYTWGIDYHLVVRHYLERFVERLKERFPRESFEIHCDTSPLADRYLAYRAGLGFYGRNQTLIHPLWGSYTVIGTILTTLSVESGEPLQQSCLDCGLCIKACPGQALSGHHLDYRHCKSYLTQYKGELTEPEINIIEKTPLLFGCDVCQEVCPHNQHIPTSPIPEFHEIDPWIDPELLRAMTNKEFKAAYGHKAWSWRGKKVILRNADLVRKEL